MENLSIDFMAQPDIPDPDEDGVCGCLHAVPKLPDPLGDRVVKECPLPPHLPLNVTQVYPQFIQFGSIAKPNPHVIRETLVLEGKIDKKCTLKLIADCQKILKKEPNVSEREGEIAIVGDIHG